jgi:hypothetical protein
MQRQSQLEGREGWEEDIEEVVERQLRRVLLMPNG